MKCLNKRLKKIYWYINGAIYDFATDISPYLNTKMRYYKLNHKRLDLKNPETFSEKLLKLKLENYDNNELVRKCADKSEVRKYLAARNLGDILIPEIGEFNTIEEINWEGLPDQFVIKLNIGCGYNYICLDKESEDKERVFDIVKKWMREAPNYYKHASEMQYKNVPLRIIVEEYIGDRIDILPEDYKFYCFNGIVQAVLYIYGRESTDQAAVFFDRNWKYLGKTGKKVYGDIPVLPSEPANYKEMIEISELLSKEFPFVRVDLYNINGKIYFGELTFTPAGGLQPSECIIDGSTMGDLLKL